MIVIFLTLLMAIVDFGVYLFKVVSIGHATRVGVRSAALNNVTRTAIKNAIVSSAVGVQVSAADITITTYAQDPVLPGNPPSVVVTTEMDHQFFASGFYQFDGIKVRSTFRGIVTTYTGKPTITF